MSKFIKRTNLIESEHISRYPEELVLSAEYRDDSHEIMYDAIDNNGEIFRISWRELYQYYGPYIPKCSICIEEMFSMLEDIISTKPVKSCRKSVFELLDMYNKEHPEHKAYVMQKFEDICKKYNKDFYMEIRSLSKEKEN